MRRVTRLLEREAREKLQSCTLDKACQTNYSEVVDTI